ncbi:hypothetical protein F2Q68_00029588 [Brassica cretica]|uniref:Tripeptidyl-peptidase 2 n=1 Tax=Brassica cretica TaxID=69181 RepID=A0A8S9GEE5_BRACR|nr:hypothetical protein F2Q68_00029588 [Brassica cretica]
MDLHLQIHGALFGGPSCSSSYWASSSTSLSLPFIFHRRLNSRSRSRSRGTRLRRSGFSAMPCSSSETSRVGCGGGGGGGAGETDNACVADFKLNESTFLASLMPKKEIGADRFIEAHPEYDGRGVVIAIFDSGFDPSAAGLHVTSDGKPKVLDVIDCTGSGDIDTSTVVKANEDGLIRGASGVLLAVNSSWKNPTGEWRVGCKLVYELFTDTLTSRVKKERRKTWDEKNQEEIAKAVKNLYDFDQKHSKVDDAKLKKTREDLQSRVDYLKKQADSYEDKGPVIDAVVWHDGEGKKEDEGEEESSQKDKFEENYKELTKWVDVKSSKFCTLTVLREKRLSRPGTALKVLDEMIQNENETASKKLYEMKLGLLEEIGWSHLVTYEKQWMQVRFPTSLPLF